jgi:NADPH-dependent 2,4-dienoyl-CoA reductase/sulfur reductase-like enzyme
MRSIEERRPGNAVVTGAGCIGLEMAEALTTRGIRGTQIEALPEVLLRDRPLPRQECGGHQRPRPLLHTIEPGSGSIAGRPRADPVE